MKGQELAVCIDWTERWENVVYTVPMRHPHDHTVNACSARRVNNGFKSRDEHFTALQTKTLFWWPLSGQEVLKPRHKKSSVYNKSDVEYMDVFVANRSYCYWLIMMITKARLQKRISGTILWWFKEHVLKNLANLFQCQCVCVYVCVNRNDNTATAQNKQEYNKKNMQTNNRQITSRNLQWPLR